MEEERKMNEIYKSLGRGNDIEERERWLVEEQMRHVQEEHKMRMKAEEQKCFQKGRCVYVSCIFFIV
ncbi:hypothetical protein TNCV_2384201 [Trichonephila clavipes]|nr:hypothetical protein TNCV_2384201 [Trichonephila clavipes]